jgi:hypothetical protein
MEHLAWPTLLERTIGRYDFEDGGYVRILAAGGLDTEAALEMAETLIAMKRAEMRRRKERAEREDDAASGQPITG